MTKHYKFKTRTNAVTATFHPRGLCVCKDTRINRTYNTTKEGHYDVSTQE